LPTQPGLIGTITLALLAAFLGGFLAKQARLPPILGYLAAGIAIGPFTPGLVADPQVAAELAEIGVILLMFGVGIHFSLRDLLRVRAIAVPGALLQIGVVTAITALVTSAWGWPILGGVVLGLALSVASTVVLLRALADRGMLDTAHGHIAVGWLIVEDLATVVVLVLLPAAAVVERAGSELALRDLGGALAVAIVNVTALALLMFLVGVRVLPWLLDRVAKTGSRELFTLAVLAVALGIAFGAAQIFGVSLALGAFLAGAAVSESDISHHAAAEALPLRDAFAVLFFVSVGMLFDPTLLLTAPLAVTAIVFLVVFAKPLVSLAIVLAFGYPLRTALVVGVGRAQIGEFSFILAAVGRSLGILPAEGHDLILAGALVSIGLNPLLFAALAPLERGLSALPAIGWLEGRRARPFKELPEPPAARKRPHVVLCGYGRVGSVVGETLARRGIAFVVLDQDRRIVERLREQGALALYGNAGERETLARAGVKEAFVIVSAISDPVATRRAVEHARALNPDIFVIARTHSEEEWRAVRGAGADVAIWSERELAIEIASQALGRLGVSPQEIAAITRGLRRL
jgi:CPA2 family monovalent cation:H+ antiporter-2